MTAGSRGLVAPVLRTASTEVTTKAGLVKVLRSVPKQKVTTATTKR